MERLLENEDFDENRLKALYDPIRLRIASCLKTPHTPKQVADILNIRPNNLYHHFRVLMQANIIQLVETKRGRGFIKEDYYQLSRLPGVPALYSVSKPREHRLLFTILQALLDDFKNSAGRYEDVSALGIREDFRFSSRDLQKVRKTIAKHRDALVEELNRLTTPGVPPNYQVSVFCFRV